MGRRNWNDGQELVLEDFNGASAALERTIYDRVAYEILQRVEDAFFDDSFLVSFASSTSITVKKGLGFQTDSSQTSPEPTKRPLYRGSDQNPSITTPDGSLDRIDIVTVKAALVDELTLSRKFKDAIDDSISTQSLVVQKDWEAVINIVAGTPDASPSAPAVPAGEVKIAELYVTAVTGMAGAGAITDSRTKLPVGGDVLINTTGYDRLTAGASTPVSTLMAEIDGFIKNGDAEYIDLEDLSADPAAPVAASGKYRFYLKNGVLFLREEAPGGAITPVGSGGGGGGSLEWQEPEGADGNPPVQEYEFGQQVYKYEQGGAGKLLVYLKVPEGYIAGRQITAYLGAYSSSAANQWKLQIVSTLIRKNLDAITDTTNQATNDTGDITNTVANQSRNVSVNLTNASGEINSVGVSAGDLIKLELTRIAPGGTEDTADLRFVKTATEVKFA